MTPSYVQRHHCWNILMDSFFFLTILVHTLVFVCNKETIPFFFFFNSDVFCIICENQYVQQRSSPVQDIIVKAFNSSSRWVHKVFSVNCIRCDRCLNRFKKMYFSLTSTKCFYLFIPFIHFLKCNCYSVLCSE